MSLPVSNSATLAAVLHSHYRSLHYRSTDSIWVCPNTCFIFCYFTFTLISCMYLQLGLEWGLLNTEC